MKKYIRYVFSILISISIVVSCGLVAFADSSPYGDELIFNMSAGKWASGYVTTETGYVSNVDPDDVTEDMHYPVGDEIVYQSGSYLGVYSRVSVNSLSNDVIMKANYSYKFGFNGFFTGTSVNSHYPVRVDYYFRYADGTQSTAYFEVDSTTVSVSSGPYSPNGNPMYYYDVSAMLQPEKDVTRVWVRLFWSASRGVQNISADVGYINPEIIIEQESFLDGLLSLIKNTLDNIGSFVLDGFSDIVDIIDLVYDSVFDGTSSLIDYVKDIFDSLVTGQFLTDVQNFVKETFVFPSLNEFESLFDKYIDEEGNLFKIIEDNQSSITDSFNDYFSENGRFLNGIFGASSLVAYVLAEVEILEPLVTFSLLIGLVGFILGVSWLVGSFINSRGSKTSEFKGKRGY